MLVAFSFLIVFVSIFAEDLPAYNCSIPLNATSTCHHYLPYDTTSTATHIQSLLNQSTENLLSALTASQCYNMSQMFVCATRYPTCQANGFPLLPCRHVCQCKSECDFLFDTLYCRSRLIPYVCICVASSQLAFSEGRATPMYAFSVERLTFICTMTHNYMYIII